MSQTDGGRPPARSAAVEEAIGEARRASEGERKTLAGASGFPYCLWLYRTLRALLLDVLDRLGAGEPVGAVLALVALQFALDGDPGAVQPPVLQVVDHLARGHQLPQRDGVSRRLRRLL